MNDSGDEYFYKYDIHGNRVYEKDCHGVETYMEHEYDSDDNIICTTKTSSRRRDPTYILKYTYYKD